MAEFIQDFTNRQYMVSQDYEFFHYRNRSLSEVEYHNHDFFEIYCLISGNVSYVTEGKSYDLSPGDILLIDNKDLHKPIIDPDEVYERIVIWLNPDFLTKESLDKSNLRTCFESKQIQEDHMLTLSSENKEMIWEKIWNFERVCNSISFGNDILKRIYLLDLIVYINKIFIETYGDNIVSRADSNEKIDAIIKYISNNIDKDLALDHVAAKFYISKYHLVRLFKKYTGFTLHRYILEKRLVLSKSLLREGKSVSETSLACGFKDYSNFIRSFKKSYNISPKKYYNQIVK